MPGIPGASLLSDLLAQVALLGTVASFKLHGLVSQENPPGIPWCTSIQVWHLTFPTWGGIYKEHEPFIILSSSSLLAVILPRQAEGCSSYLMPRS